MPSPDGDRALYFMLALALMFVVALAITVLWT